MEGWRTGESRSRVGSSRHNASALDVTEHRASLHCAPLYKAASKVDARRTRTHHGLLRLAAAGAVMHGPATCCRVALPKTKTALTDQTYE
ncbi:hypothetical protein FOA52_014267 [Chlamydomonas sp. UWO 241]|nr:hypothetical protein FOA52_014267 [Chlamydomonas sp. UWO 241]